MIAGLDSSGFHPTLNQVQSAYAQGIRVWGKYLPGYRIYSGDSKADFDILKAGGMKTIAFCSGHADPKQMKALGQAWGVDWICLDVETSIRGDDAWVQPWLDVSGAGLYGNPPVFRGRRAPFFIMADYIGTYANYHDPRATWISSPPPSVPHGWQWAGSVDAFGGGVDRLWLDDWFAQGSPAPPQGDEDMAVLAQGADGAVYLVSNPPYGPARHVADAAELDAYKAALPDPTIHTYPQFVIDRAKEVPDAAVVLAAIAKIQAGGAPSGKITGIITGELKP